MNPLRHNHKKSNYNATDQEYQIRQQLRNDYMNYQTTSQTPNYTTNHQQNRYETTNQKQSNYFSKTENNYQPYDQFNHGPMEYTNIQSPQYLSTDYLRNAERQTNNRDFFKPTMGDDLPDNQQSEEENSDEENSQSSESESGSEQSESESEEEDVDQTLKETIPKNFRVIQPLKTLPKINLNQNLKELELKQKSQLLEKINRMTIMSKKESIDLMLNKARLGISDKVFKMNQKVSFDDEEITKENEKALNIKQQIQAKMQKLTVSHFFF